MDFTKFDMSLLVVMSLAIISMSFVMPAVGLADSGGDANVSSSDIPELSVEADRFDFAGNFPDRPGTPAKGQLEYDPDNPIESDNFRQIGGGSTDLVLALDDNPTNASEGRIEFRTIDSGTGGIIYSNTTTFVEDDFVTDSNGSWEVHFDALEVTPNESIRMDYEIKERDESDDGFLGGLPVVGTLFDTGQAIASVVAWIGSIFWWFFALLSQTAINLIGILFDVATFTFGLVAWLTTTYGAVIDNAQGFATVFVALPGVILSMLFAKLGFIGISLLPTT